MGITLDGVTTAVVLFLFTCLVIPKFIKNRTQYYVAFGCVLGIILMHTLAMMIQNPGFNVFASVVVGFLQFIAVLMLVMCVGGMDLKTIAADVAHSYEVIRRGEETKEVIVPLTGQMPHKNVDDDIIPERIELEPPATPQRPTDTTI